MNLTRVCINVAWPSQVTKYAALVVNKFLLAVCTVWKYSYVETVLFLMLYEL